ncbi:MAG: hypothetical protein LBB80_06145, partial [Treponema sp.]|nr:hypothetical protein [Treponema sp.]
RKGRLPYVLRFPETFQDLGSGDGVPDVLSKTGTFQGQDLLIAELDTEVCSPVIGFQLGVPPAPAVKPVEILKVRVLEVAAVALYIEKFRRYLETLCLIWIKIYTEKDAGQTLNNELFLMVSGVLPFLGGIPLSLGFGDGKGFS